MKSPSRITVQTGLLLALAAFAAQPALPADALPKTARPAIYDEKADGAAQITNALAVAKKENKRVLLQFGANWCGWCHRLHKLFQTDEKIRSLRNCVTPRCRAGAWDSCRTRAAA